MKDKLDLIGKQFGRWTVVAIKGKVRGGCLWVCECECGAIKPVYNGHLISGASKSCGCLAKEITSKIKRTHGLTESPEYEAWINLKNRCYRKKDKRYADYGLRGIKVCERWLMSFSDFVADVGRRPSPEHSINRKNNDGDYEPGNCEWATRKTQARNKRNSLWITFRGVTISAAELAEKFGVDYKLMHARIQKGWSIEQAIFSPKYARV